MSSELCAFYCWEKLQTRWRAGRRDGSASRLGHSNTASERVKHEVSFSINSIVSRRKFDQHLEVEISQRRSTSTLEHWSM